MKKEIEMPGGYIIAPHICSHAAAEQGGGFVFSPDPPGRILFCADVTRQ